jgi:general secretion pathway protein G
MTKGKPPDPVRKNGFSLIELMIVLVIIGLLVAILIPNLLDAIDRARQRSTVAELRAWANGLGAYMAEIGTLPLGTGAPIVASTIHNDLVPYAVSALHDQDTWKNNLFYIAPAATPISYTIMSGGKNGAIDICITPQNWLNYSEDIAVSDGLFICSPS